MPPRRSVSVATPRATTRPKAGEPAQTFVFDATVAALLADVATRAGVSQAGVLELALRRLAHEGEQAGAEVLVDAAPRGRVAEGRRQGVRLTPHAQRLLHDLLNARPRYGETRVAVAELALRRFARFAEQEGLLAPPSDPG